MRITTHLIKRFILWNCSLHVFLKSTVFAKQDRKEWSDLSTKSSLIFSTKNTAILILLNSPHRAEYSRRSS